MNSQSEWIDAAYPTMEKALTKAPPRFSSDWIRQQVETQCKAPAHPNWWGICIGRLVVNGCVRRVGSIRSTRSAANGRWVGVYRRVS